MANLAVDQGNTFTKVGLFEKDRLVRSWRLPNEDLSGEINRLSPDCCIISSVLKGGAGLERIDPAIRLILLNSDTPAPVVNLYETPATLGPDRLAAVIGSRLIKPTGPNLVIDCGTCITYDILDAGDRYLGGAISPGMDLRFRSLNNFTSNLPLINFEEPDGLLGKNTKASILSGVIWGIVAEMEGVIARYREIFPGLSVFLSGGGAKYFDSKLRGAIFVEPDLVLYGLNKILRFNVETN